MNDRRELLKLAALGGGAVFLSGLAGCASASRSAAVAKGAADDDFYFVQLSDSHWGFSGRRTRTRPTRCGTPSRR